MSSNVNILLLSAGLVYYLTASSGFLTVAENLQLGKYSGLCKLYVECVVIRDWDKEDFLNEQIKPQLA